MRGTSKTTSIPSEEARSVDRKPATELEASLKSIPTTTKSPERGRPALGAIPTQRHVSSMPGGWEEPEQIQAQSEQIHAQSEQIHAQSEHPGRIRPEDKYRLR
jgi:hypothetical protein